jgi:DNA ligase (NAD+)
MKWLASAGFEVPWWMASAGEDLSTTLMKRRSESIYPIDGLVVGTDTVPLGVGGGETRNPTDSIAFKLSLDDQKAETTVIQIEWNASRHGMLIPRIQIEPVEIGGATIQWLSGHNAAFIFEKKLGPGARIVIRRSGDVIPALDSVLRGAPAAQMPECDWEWDSTKVQAVANKVAGSKALLHALQTLEVDGIGPGLVAKLVEGGIDTMLKLWNAKTLNIGSGRGPALMASLRKKREEASLVTLLVASNLLPRGVGERKLRVLFDKEADPRKWTSSMKVAGWSTETLEELVSALPAALDWSVSSFPGFVASAPAPAAAAPASAPASAPVAALQGHVVFTGVRDKMLEGIIKDKWSVDDSITKKTTVLVTADEAKETGKVKKAREAGVRIMTITEFRRLC